MARTSFHTLTAVWLSVLCSTPIDARWIAIEEWGRTLRLKPNFDTAEVQEDYEVISSAVKIWDTDEQWTSGDCINDIVIHNGAAVRNIEYYTGNPSPLFPYVLAAIEIHDGENCNDENSITVVFPTEPGREPEVYGPAGLDDDEDEIYEEGEDIFGGDSQNPTWVSNGAPPEIHDILNAPTLVEEDFVQNPEEFDSDEVVSATGMDHDIWGSAADLDIAAGNIQQQQGEYEPTVIVEEEYDHLGPWEDDDDAESQNNLKKRSPFPPKSEPSVDLGQSQGSLGWTPSLPGQGVIDVGTIQELLNAGNNQNGQLPMPIFHTQPREQDGFSEGVAAGTGNFDLGGTAQLEHLSPELNPLATQDVLDLEPLVMESRDVPFEGEDGDPAFVINILQTGLLFRKPTSIRLISDLSQWYRIPAGGIQTNTGLRRASINSNLRL
ncbi:hypothetical protein TWF481_000181 [Arthrobotrys musiformis]|uniref:Uncharacterized protein n=1 Tax=Arthrobotrys musiformis TaxID=47236 RepID=A0AAV9WLU7_9PEZI